MEIYLIDMYRLSPYSIKNTLQQQNNLTRIIGSGDGKCIKTQSAYKSENS